jgi:WD40 repeat protein
VRPFGGATPTTRVAAFSPDGDRLVVVDGDRPRARIYDAATGRPEGLVPTKASANAPLYSAQFVANPLRVLTVDASFNARLSDPATGDTVTLPGKVLPGGVAATSDGQRLATGTIDGKLRVFDGDGTTLLSRDVPGGPVNSVAFDRTGEALVTVSQRGAARAWDSRTLAPIPLTAPGGIVTGASFSPDGRFVLVTDEATARLWDWTRQRVIFEFPGTRGVRAELSPDGSRIVIAGKNRLEVLGCDACAPLDELEDRARALLPYP